MRAPGTRGTDVRSVIPGKGTGPSRATTAGLGAAFATALKQSLTQDGADKNVDSAATVTGQMSADDNSAVLERAVPGRARERRNTERHRDGTENDMAPGGVALPFEQLRVRGMGLDTGGAADTGRRTPTMDGPESARTASHRVIAGHVLGLRVTPETDGRELTTAMAWNDGTLSEKSEPVVPQRSPAETSTTPQAPEPRPEGPSMGPARSAKGDPAVHDLRTMRHDPAAGNAPSTPELRQSPVGAAAVLERRDAIAAARQELVHGASARPVPSGPTVDALPAGLGGALTSGSPRTAGDGHGTRDGGREGDAKDRGDRTRPVEESRNGATGTFVAPTRDAGATDTTIAAPAGSTQGASSTERVAEVVEQLDVRNVEAGRNTSPLKVNLGELGEVRVSMTRDEGLAVRLDASDPRAAVAFETGRRELEMALESHGLRELHVAVDGSVSRVSMQAQERSVSDRVQVGPVGAEATGRTGERDGQMGQDPGGRQGSGGRESNTQDERDHRDAVNAAIERRERERRFAPTLGPVAAGRRLGSA